MRLEEHLTRNNLHAPHQFGYKKDHSTEALLLKIVNNLLMWCDENLASVVLLLDLSAAFDTVDHQKLLDILQYDYGITGSAYNWFESFLIGRTFKIKIGDSYSEETLLPYGVAQGSVLGPRLFNTYTKSIHQYVEQSQFDIEGFADDHQLMKHFIPSFQRQVLGDGIQNCLKSIYEWMNDHFLRLNPDKTEIIVIAPPSIKKDILVGGMFLNKECIRFVDNAKNLGFTLDTGLTFETQINKLVKACFMMIRKLYSIRHFLTSSQLKLLVCSKIFSKIDYCNALYFGINATTTRKLQHTQNCAARLIIKRGCPMSLDNFFLESHWLKIRERILYKIILMVHKCIHLRAPQSLSGLLKFGDSGRTMKLCESKVNSKFGSRAFSHVGPKLWNLLPQVIRCQYKTDVFKKILKSYLMVNAENFHARFNAR